MATKKKPAVAVGLASAMSAKEIALSELARAASKVLHLCFDLAADANLAPDMQNLFFTLGSRALQVMVRIEQKWTPLLERTPPSIASLRDHVRGMDDAAAAIGKAKGNPLPQNLLAAATLTSSALDMADAMIDLV